MSKRSKLSIPEQIKKKKKNRLIVKLLILFLSLILIFLVYFKKNLFLSRFYLIGQDEIIVNTGDRYEDEGARATILFKDISKHIKTKNEVDSDKPGEYIIEYDLKIKYLNIDDKITRKVIVKDIIAPELEVEKLEVKMNLWDEYHRPSYKATDNVDGDITDKVKIEGNVDTNTEGDYIEKLIVTDEAGNTTTKEIKVKVEEKYKHSYINVNKTTQTVEYYEYDELLLTSPIVTGNDYNTPLGEFIINNKLEYAILVGEDYEVGVNYWMAYIGSTHGFHDATWRSSFGGDIYTYDPTHGCINMPTDKAGELFYLVEVGTPVYIFRE